MTGLGHCETLPFETPLFSWTGRQYHHTSIAQISSFLKSRYNPECIPQPRLVQHFSLPTASPLVLVSKKHGGTRSTLYIVQTRKR